MDQYTDSRILEGIINSDPLVIRYIYNTYYQKIENFLVAKGGDPEHIRDVFQEAMFIIYKKVTGSGLVLSCTFSTYLFAVCKNVWRQDLRKRRYMSVEDSSLDVIAEAEEEPNEMKEKLTALFRFHLSQLSEDCRKLLEMHFRKAPISEIQEALGYSSEHYTSDKKYRCKQSLLRRIKNDPNYKKIISDG